MSSLIRGTPRVSLETSTLNDINNVIHGTQAYDKARLWGK